MYISCVVPARNEEGHLINVINQVLEIEQIRDILIVEGGSTDNTFEEASRIAAMNPARVRVFKQSGKGKFDAVQYGASFAREEFILIWDADGTVPLECTKKVVNHALETNHATTGDRLQGNREKGSMQHFNYIGNWFFAVLWAPLLGSKPIDMLCGTKIVQTRVFRHIPQWLLKVDPYGDFALMATARAMGYAIHSIPVDYLARRYGESNIRRWSGGSRLLASTVLVYFWFGKNRVTQ